MKNLLKIGVLVALTIGTSAQAQCFATPEEHAQAVSDFKADNTPNCWEWFLISTWRTATCEAKEENGRYTYVVGDACSCAPAPYRLRVFPKVIVNSDCSLSYGACSQAVGYSTYKGAPIDSAGNRATCQTDNRIYESPQSGRSVGVPLVGANRSSIGW